MSSLRIKETHSSLVSQEGEYEARSSCIDSKSYRGNGSVYTPQTLANYVAHKLYQYAINLDSDAPNQTKQLKILDPACGDGELLLAIEKSIPPNLKVKLYGVDIDKKAINKAKKRIETPSTFVNTNGLCPFNKVNGSGWKELKRRFNIDKGIDCIIANPPWGADIQGYKKLIDKSDFFLNEGQIDSSDLFIEASLNILKKGGFIAFIIPDSLFYQERTKLRKFLLNNTRIYFIGRFGEKIFKDINRACAVVICQKEQNVSNHNIECLRLNPEYRSMILNGEITFHQAEYDLSHRVNQKRFSSNSGYVFNIDLNESMACSFDKISLANKTIREYLISFRGVEISKKGKTIKCLNCKSWTPLPKSETSECKFCCTVISVSQSKVHTIIHKNDAKNRMRLIVGENIQRNQCHPSLWIDTGKKGINYKDDWLYSGEKIVVRKTGIGISSSIDYTNCFTNQVVYILKLKDITCCLPIEFFQAIISSRAIFFYISMMNGENEWKSHPYVTQNQILDIPIPDSTKFNEDLTNRIGNLCKQLRQTLISGKTVSRELDAKLERMVADAYKLTKSDYKTIYSAIEGSQDLLPIKALKNISISDIF